MTATGYPPVPDRYRGVWSRTLLQTPTVRDETTAVHWLQTSHHHGDLRVPAADGRPATPADCQGFSGLTQVVQHADIEVCTWHRQIDLQPPGLHPDAGHIHFETPDRLIETGVHGDYLEVWERLPGSTGRFVVLESKPPAPAARLLVAGDFLLRLRPRALAWPAGTRPGDTLSEVASRHPADATALLAFEIRFGVLRGDMLSIASSTHAALAGTMENCAIRRTSPGEAVVSESAGSTGWRVVEWD